ncbi:MAG: hypothetical protein U0T80_06985 [Flavobacteriaceae bacterium]
MYKIVTQFKGWSIDGISYYIKADVTKIVTHSECFMKTKCQMNG